jgi:hypothetical protein
MNATTGSRASVQLGVLLLGVLTAAPAFAEPPPWLSPMDALSASSAVARQVSGVRDVIVSPQGYDASIGQWITLVRPGDGEGFIVTIDENTGEVCARYEHRDGCAATGNVSEQVLKAKTIAKAREEAGRHPPADLPSLWIAVLSDLVPKVSGPSTPKSRWYVTVNAGDGKTVDPPAAVLSRFHPDGIDVLPGSKAPKPAGAADTPNGPMHYHIDVPLRRPDGNYDVTYVYYCGRLCAGSTTLVMSRDAAGWHIVSRLTNWVS